MSQYLCRRAYGAWLAVTLVLLFAPSGRVHGQTITQWNFNASNLTPDINLTNGTPSLSLFGGTTATFAAGTGSNNANSSDPTQPGQAWNTTTYAAQNTASGTRGIEMFLPTTDGSSGFSNLVLRFDQRLSNAASRTYELQYTTNGTNWQTFTSFFGHAGDSFATHTFDFTGVTAANNNPNFGIRVVSVFDPLLGNAYGPADPTSNYATSGTVRYDMVTLSQGRVWVGGSSGGAIGDSANYAGSPTLGSTDTLVFGNTSNTTIHVPTSITLGQLLFRGDAPSHTVTFDTGATLALTNGIVNRSTNTQTFNVPVTFQNGTTVSNDGTVIFNGNISMSPTTQGLQIIGSGTTVINGIYAGGDITISNGSRLTGTGTINNEVHVYTATIRGGSPSNPYGTLTLNVPGGDLEFYAAPGDRAPVFEIAVNRTAPNTVQNSLIALVGGSNTDLELNNAGVGSNLIRFRVLANNLQLEETYSFTFLTTDSTGSIEWNNVGQPDGYVFPTTGYVLEVPGYTLDPAVTEIKVVDVTGVGSTLVMTFKPVPEPGAVLGLAGGAWGLGIWAQRRWRRCWADRLPSGESFGRRGTQRGAAG